MGHFLPTVDGKYGSLFALLINLMNLIAHSGGYNIMNMWRSWANKRSYRLQLSKMNMSWSYSSNMKRLYHRMSQSPSFNYITMSSSSLNSMNISVWSVDSRCDQCWTVAGQSVPQLHNPDEKVAIQPQKHSSSLHDTVPRGLCHEPIGNSFISQCKCLEYQT